MACGCVLITYGNEGSDEITENGVNGFVIPPGDLDKVFETVQHLKNSPTLLSQITFNARQNMEKNFSMNIYVDKIESYLLEVMKTEPKQWQSPSTELKLKKSTIIFAKYNE